MNAEIRLLLYCTWQFRIINLLQLHLLFVMKRRAGLLTSFFKFAHVIKFFIVAIDVGSGTTEVSLYILYIYTILLARQEITLLGRTW